MTKRKSLIIANWKNHPDTVREAKTLFDDVKRRVARMQDVSVVVCPPELYLGLILAEYQGSSIALGAQDVFWESKGSHTGMLTPKMLQKNGVSFIIAGHSERRAAGESNEEIAKKIKASRKAKRSVVLCVGESDRDTEGEYLTVLERQIEESMDGISRQMVMRDFSIAYEPVWAIGKSAQEALNPQGVHQMVLFIRKILARKYGRKRGFDIPVLYGGSVEPANAAELFAEGGIDGVLVGHASLNPEDFVRIVQAAK